MPNIEVDKNDRVIGLRPIEDFYTGKHIHRSSHLILLNSNNQILLHKRSPNRKWYPNLYNYSASGAVADESYKDCIKKEMHEELGISIPVKYLFKYPYFDKYDKSFHAIFLGQNDEKIKPNPKEISEIKWLNADDLKQSIKADPEIYVPHFIIGIKKYLTDFHK